jgi:hypothetical protein
LKSKCPLCGGGNGFPQTQQEQRIAGNPWVIGSYTEYTQLVFCKECRVQFEPLITWQEFNSQKRAAKERQRISELDAVGLARHNAGKDSEKIEEKIKSTKGFTFLFAMVLIFLGIARGSDIAPYLMVAFIALSIGAAKFISDLRLKQSQLVELSKHKSDSEVARDAIAEKSNPKTDKQVDDAYGLAEFLEGDEQLQKFAELARLGHASALASYSWGCLEAGRHQEALDLYDETRMSLTLTAGDDLRYELANCDNNQALNLLASGRPESEVKGLWDRNAKFESPECVFYSLVMKVRDGNANKNEIRKLSADLRQEVKEILNEGKKSSGWYKQWCYAVLAEFGDVL